MRLRALLPAISFLAALALPAAAEDLASVEKRISSVEIRVAGILDGFGFNNDSDRAHAQRQAEAPSELSLRVAAIENQLRQVTGEVERISHQLRLLEDQLKRAEAEPRAPESPGAPRLRAGAAPPAAEPPRPPQQAAVQPAAPAPVQASPGAAQRGEPSRDPGQLPGAPAPSAPVPAAPANRPLDLGVPGSGAAPAAAPAASQTAVMAPTATAKDEYDLAYGYVLRGDFDAAEASFRQFLAAYPNDRLAGNAEYWLGESLFRRGKYRAAADAFLKTYTAHGDSPKAPDSLARLGAALRALDEKEAACATFAEFGRKFPRASADLRRQVQAEQKRASC